MLWCIIGRCSGAPSLSRHTRSHGNTRRSIHDLFCLFHGVCGLAPSDHWLPDPATSLSAEAQLHSHFLCGLDNHNFDAGVDWDKACQADAAELLEQKAEVAAIMKSLPHGHFIHAPRINKKNRATVGLELRTRILSNTTSYQPEEFTQLSRSIDAMVLDEAEKAQQI